MAYGYLGHVTAAPHVVQHCSLNFLNDCLRTHQANVKYHADKKESTITHHRINDKKELTIHTSADQKTTKIIATG